MAYAQSGMRSEEPRNRLVKDAEGYRNRHILLEQVLQPQRGPLRNAG